jgi:hypothetical protein
MLLGALTIAPALAAQQPTLNPSPKEQSANRRELVGVVRDSSGAGIEGATIEIRGGSAVTSAKGTFQLWTGDIDTLTISIRRIGYAPISALIAARGGRWDTVSVEMDRTSLQLAAVTVTGAATRRALGLRTFEERRSRGGGIFITRDEITARNTMQTSDILRGRRGVDVVRLRDGTNGVRFASQRVKGCIPLIWVDGQAAPGLEVDEINATDIEAMELYETIGSLPYEFTPHSGVKPCGTIVVWTRIPGSR